MSEVEQPIACLKDNNPSVTSRTGRVRRSRLITTAVGILGLVRKLVVLPISMIGSSLGLVTGSIGLSFRVAGLLLSFGLNMVGLTSFGGYRKPSSTPSNRKPSSTPSTRKLSSTPSEVSVSETAAAEEPEAMDFLSEFESRYGKIHPNFVPGSFMDAVETSRRECKLLFVYLHSPDHPDTPSFCKDTLCSEFLSTFVNENFVSRGDSILEKEGLDISKSIKASRFPFWAVIKVDTGESFSFLRRFEGPSSPEEMVTELQTVLEENSPAVVAESVDTTDEQTSNKEKEDAPYENEADSANERETKEDQTGIESEAESEAKLPEEETSQLMPEPEEGKDVIQVFVRLPTRERITRKFPRTATLQSVYDFVDSSGCLDIGSYNLVTFFPRVVYGEGQFSSTLEELGLHAQTSLFVELSS